MVLEEQEVNEIAVVKEIELEKYMAATRLKAPKIKVGQELVFVDSYYFRPTEVDLLLGDPTKAKEKLGWKPKYTVNSLIKEMVASDVTIFRNKLTNG